MATLLFPDVVLNSRCRLGERPRHHDCCQVTVNHTFTSRHSHTRTWQIEERPLRRKFNYHQQDNSSSCNKMQCLCKQTCEQRFGCRNGAATESLICSVSSSSTLSSSSLIQRLLLFTVISVSTSISFAHSFPCLAKKHSQKTPTFAWNPPVQNHTSLSDFLFRQMSKPIRQRDVVHLLSV